MNVDDAIRRFRSGVRGPQTDLVATIVAAAPTAGGVHLRHRVRMRTVAVAATVVIAVVVAAAMGILLRDGGRPNPVPAAPTIPPARVDWGMVATLKLTPDPGVSIEEMRRRLSDALAYRTHDHGGAGVEIISASGNAVTVRLPGAETPDQVREYLSFFRLVIVDSEASTVATAPTIDDLPNLPSLTNEPRRYYYVQERNRSKWARPRRLLSQRDMDELAARHPGEVATRSVPWDTSILGGGNGAPVRLVRRTPIIPSSSIGAIRRVDDALQISTEAIPADRRVTVFATTAIDGGPDISPEAVGSGTLRADGTLELPLKGAPILHSVARPDIGGVLTFERATQYGDKPSEDLEEYPTARTKQPPTASLPRDIRWVRLLSGGFDDGHRLLLAAEHRGVLVATAFADDAKPDQAPDVAAAVRVSTEKPLRSICPVGVGTPQVVRCGGSVGTSPAPNGMVRVQYVNYGRVQSDVAEIEVRVLDRVYPATIQNGWWVTWVQAEVPASDMPPLLDDYWDPNPTIQLQSRDIHGQDVPISPTAVIRE